MQVRELIKTETLIWSDYHSAWKVTSDREDVADPDEKTLEAVVLK